MSFYTRVDGINVSVPDEKYITFSYKDFNVMPTVKSELIEEVNDISIKRVIKTSSRKLILATDNKIYERKDGKYSAILDKTFPSGVDVIELKKKGEKTLLFIGDDGGIFEDGERVEHIKRGQHLVAFGRLFSASGRTLRYSKPFDYENYSTGVKLYGFFETEEDLGDIVGLFELYNKVCVLCKNGIVLFSPFMEESEYSAERMFTDGIINALENSAVKIGDELFFITDGNLARLNAKKTLSLFLLPKRLDFSIGHAVEVDGYYTIPVLDYGKKKTFFAKIGKENRLFTKDGGKVIENFGFFADGNAIYKKNIDDSSLTGEIASDFNSLSVKRIKRIVARNLDGAVLKVEGAKRVKSVNITSDYCVSYLCHCSENFTLSLSKIDTDSELYIEYLDY